MSCSPIPRPARRALSLATLVTALLAGATPAARAAVTPQAQAVLDRYVKAMGGQAFLDTRTLHVRATIEAFMMKGTAESWSERPDRGTTRFEIGPLKVGTGYDGSVGWRTDVSGKALKLDGKDLEDVKSSTWFELDSFLQPDQGGGQVVYAGEESDTLGDYDVLEITPPVGRSRRCGFDQSTGLLRKIVSKTDQQVTVTRNRDFRPVRGRLVAFASATELVGQPMNTIRSTVDSVWVNEPVPPGIFAMPAEAAAGARYLQTPGVARVPFEYRSRHVWIRASVNGGPPADFIYDTGASLTVIDSAYAARIGLGTEGRQQGQGAGATGSASFAVVQSLAVAAEKGNGVEVRDLRVGVLSLNPFLAPFFWKECAGIVGFDVINRFVNEIDYDSEVLSFYDPKSFRYAGGGTAIPMTLAGHTPVVKMKLDDTLEGDFRVDVGSGSTVDLHTPFVKEHDLMARTGRGVDVKGGGFGGTFTTRMVRMKKLAIGPYSWPEPLVSLSQATAGAFTSEDYAGNIGNHLLERFKVTLDYERRQMWLEPGARYASRDEMSRAGLQLFRLRDTVRVVDVLPGSPAEKAGLRADDVVRAIDGKMVDEIGPDGITALFEDGAVGSVHTLDVVRAGKGKKIRVQLKEML